MKFINKHSFICDHCRTICQGNCHELLTAILNGKDDPDNMDLVGRKQIIHCLGKYCDSPCQLQREDYTPYNQEDGIKPLLGLINYLGNKVHQLIEEKTLNDES